MKTSPDASLGYTFVYRDHKQIQFRYSICLAWYIFKRIKFEIEVTQSIHKKVLLCEFLGCKFINSLNFTVFESVSVQFN